MLLIPCPYCGPRAESEFAHGGEAHIIRPQQPAMTDDAPWAAYLFMRHNEKGPIRERWRHAHGCGRWFHVLRDTVSDDILAVYRIGDPPPPVPERTPTAERK